MQKSLILTGIALLMGGLIPLQSSLNTHIAQHFKAPLLATFVNFAGGFLFLIILLFLIFKVELPSLSTVKQIPLYYFLGGFIGVGFVTMVVILTPRIGITNVLAGALVGQLIISALFDHFGLLNLNVHPLTWHRMAGIAFLILGIVLTQK